MCCFSRDVKRVANTNIFARASKESGQYLVYAMTVSAPEDLAMILPIPVPAKTKEDAVKFINLEKYPTFFRDLHALYPVIKTKADEPARPSRAATGSAPLKVVEVGSFEASFAPTLGDMDRLDERFKIPKETWKKIAKYDAYGFVIFKLKKGDAKVHPMAFEFPRADATRLFFPTVHIHDGKVHDRAGFDHTLYLQLSSEEAPMMFDWEESPSHANDKVDVDKAKGIVKGDAHVYRHEMHGRYKNDDVMV